MGSRLRQPLQRDRRLRQLSARQDRPPLRRGLARNRQGRGVQAAEGRLMSRLPIRIRLTLAFTLVIAGLLAATGLFLYLRLGSALGRALDQGLRTRAADVAALVQQ